jgi:putative transposase
VTERSDVTAQGYRRFRCRDYGKPFNEHSDGVLNRTCRPGDIIAFVVFCRQRYRLTLRDLSKILLLRGFTVSHETIRTWEAKLLPIMGDALRKRRHGTRRRSDRSWYVNEAYLKVQGCWCYWYRAIDRDGNLIDTMLNESRDLAAVKALFRLAKATAGFTPDRVTTDGARLLSKGSPLDPGPGGPAPDERLFEQPARTGSPRHQGAQPMYARLQGS